MVTLVTYTNFVELSELSCIIGTIVTHLVCIAVLLRQLPSTMTVVTRLYMQDCVQVEVTLRIVSTENKMLYLLGIYAVLTLWCSRKYGATTLIVLAPNSIHEVMHKLHALRDYTAV